MNTTYTAVDIPTNNPNGRSVTFVVISDTHNLHDSLEDLPSADILIHAGDFTSWGTAYEVIKFNSYLGRHSHKFKHIVIVPGNHEFYPDAISLLLTNVTHYLRDACVTLEGIKIYGSRFKPYWRWLPYGRPCDAKTNYDDVKNENDIDVIITHVAPYFKHASRMFRCGSELITELTLEKKPRVHIFGHDHHAYGALQIDETTFIAAASVSGHNKTLNKPIMFSISK